MDGAYDIRHEIIKKRIDKARIKGSSERLTQPGKIAIVYSHGREMREYMKYIDYLQDENYLEGEIENYELENLQGVYGLHALRVTVNMEASRKRPFVAPESVKQAVALRCRSPVSPSHKSLHKPRLSFPQPRKRSHASGGRDWM